jgi:hypothetical protein
MGDVKVVAPWDAPGMRKAEQFHNRYHDHPLGVAFFGADAIPRVGGLCIFVPTDLGDRYTTPIRVENASEDDYSDLKYTHSWEQPADAPHDTVAVAVLPDDVTELEIEALTAFIEAFIAGKGWV